MYTCHKASQDAKQIGLPVGVGVSQRGLKGATLDEAYVGKVSC